MQVNKDLLSYGFKNPCEIQIIKRKENENMKKIEMPRIDVTKYVGTKATIVKAEIKDGKFGKHILVETNPIPFQDGDSLPNDKQLRGSIILGLVEKDGELFIGKDSKADKFCKNHKIDIEKIPSEMVDGQLIKEFEGKTVVLQKTETGFLTIA